MKKYFLALLSLLIFVCDDASAQNDSATNKNSYFLKVHFLYGSKPKKKFRPEEPKWFGGILGGHVGIEKDSGKIFNFNPAVSFHLFAHKNNRHSKFKIHNERMFYSILGAHEDSVKKLCVIIPITKGQAVQFDSLSGIYLAETPFDYAFFGMRCGAAAYHVLAEVGIVKKFGYRKTFMKIFYPKNLRKRLLKTAKKNNWQLIQREGSERRVWEQD